MATQKVFLIGYMGSGKSTIAKALAIKTNIPYFDLDTSIENRVGKSISEIFEEKGELYFRLLEHDVLKEFINNSDSMILSWGGGTPCYANNHEFLMDENTVSIYLSATIDTIHNRILAEKETRPLVANKSEAELKEFIAKHIFDRSYYYNKAKYKVVVDQKSVDEIIIEIENLLA